MSTITPEEFKGMSAEELSKITPTQLKIILSNHAKYEIEFKQADVLINSKRFCGLSGNNPKGCNKAGNGDSKTECTQKHDGVTVWFKGTQIGKVVTSTSTSETTIEYYWKCIPCAQSAEVKSAPQPSVNNVPANVVPGGGQTSAINVVFQAPNDQKQGGAPKPKAPKKKGKSTSTNVVPPVATAKENNASGGGGVTPVVNNKTNKCKKPSNKASNANANGNNVPSGGSNPSPDVVSPVPVTNVNNVPSGGSNPSPDVVISVPVKNNNTASGGGNSSAEVKLKKPPLCRNFQKGKPCEEGCTYSHIKCTKAGCTGKTLDGKDCFFGHPKKDSFCLEVGAKAPSGKDNSNSSANTSGVTATSGDNNNQQLCKAFQNGDCKFGDNCRFIHDFEVETDSDDEADTSGNPAFFEDGYNPVMRPETPLEKFIYDICDKTLTTTDATGRWNILDPELEAAFSNLSKVQLELLENYVRSNLNGLKKPLPELSKDDEDYFLTTGPVKIVVPEGTLRPRYISIDRYVECIKSLPARYIMEGIKFDQDTIIAEATRFAKIEISIEEADHVIKFFDTLIDYVPPNSEDDESEDDQSHHSNDGYASGPDANNNANNNANSDTDDDEDIDEDEDDDCEWGTDDDEDPDSGSNSNENSP
jgi:hypothetical protein